MPVPTRMLGALTIKTCVSSISCGAWIHKTHSLSTFATDLRWWHECYGHSGTSRFYAYGPSQGHIWGRWLRAGDWARVHHSVPGQRAFMSKVVLLSWIHTAGLTEQSRRKGLRQSSLVVCTLFEKNQDRKDFFQVCAPPQDKKTPKQNNHLM